MTPSPATAAPTSSPEAREVLRARTQRPETAAHLLAGDDRPAALFASCIDWI